MRTEERVPEESEGPLEREVKSDPTAGRDLKERLEGPVWMDQRGVQDPQEAPESRAARDSRVCPEREARRDRQGQRETRVQLEIKEQKERPERTEPEVFLVLSVRWDPQVQTEKRERPAPRGPQDAAGPEESPVRPESPVPPAPWDSPEPPVVKVSLE